MKLIRLLVACLFVASVLSAHAQEKYMMVFLHKRLDAPKLTQEENDRIMSGHMGNIQKLAKENKLKAAGPFEGGGGIFVFKASSVADVEAWIQPDPGIQAKRWNVEILPYEPWIGGICPVGEKFEMIMYSVVHFKPKVYKFNVQEASTTIQEHRQYIRELAKAGNVITHVSFGGTDGSFLVMKGEVPQDAIMKDPAVVGALFEPEFKQLYIAKGSFCEPK